MRSDAETDDAMLRITRVIAGSLDSDAIIEQALALALEIGRGTRAMIVSRDDRRLSTVRDASASASTIARHVPQALVASVIESGQAAFTDAAPNVCATACVLLGDRDAIAGALYLEGGADEATFDARTRGQLVSFGIGVGLALDNARIFEREGERADRIGALHAFGARILEAIASGVITLSSQLEITTFNRSAEETLGIRSGDVIGRSVDAIAAIVPDLPELLEMFFASGAVQLRAEVEALRGDNRRLVVEIALAPLDGTRAGGVALMLSDVTKYRRLEIAHEAQTEKNARVAESFSRYLAPHIVTSLMQDPRPLKLGGVRTRATMFFADVRGFTSLAARLPPERVVEILNGYFEEAVRVVFEHDGLLDKFYGDGMMAVFGPPRARDDDAARAVAAAISLQEIVADLEPRIGYPLVISIGLATGDVVAGHFGSTRRMDYTVIGDAVNLANGLQSAAPAGSIYCDEATYIDAGPIALPIERVKARIKGRSELVSAYAITPTPR